MVANRDVIAGARVSLSLLIGALDSFAMTTTPEAITIIAAAFADTPRPTNVDLLHEECHDDMDIRGLYPSARWQDVDDTLIEYEYAALFFLSPGGFRFFLPAYMTWVLQRPYSEAAVVDSTIRVLTPQSGDLEAFSLSKFTEFNADERAAVVAFLEAMTVNKELDIAGALEHWQAAR